MPLHTINDTPVFIHQLQSVMLISTPVGKIIDKDAVKAIVREVVLDNEEHEGLDKRCESKYQIQLHNLGLDVLVRRDNTLKLYSFTDKGEVIEEHAPRTLEQAGMFHFQFTIPEKPMEAFRIGDAEFEITCVTTESFNALTVDEQNRLLDEIAAFNKAHFPQHFEGWALNDESSEVVREHFRHLQASLSSLYIIRDKDANMIAINGISATSDHRLTYQSMTITRTCDRGKGFMAVDLGRATSDYPDAAMTAYFVNPEIRRTLGAEAMTRPNIANPLPAERSHYLEGKLAAIDTRPNDGLDSARAAHASMRQQLREVRAGDVTSSVPTLV